MPVSSTKFSLKRKHRKLIKQTRTVLIIFVIYVLVHHVDYSQLGDDTYDDHYHHHHDKIHSRERKIYEAQGKRFPDQPDAWEAKTVIRKAGRAVVANTGPGSDTTPPTVLRQTLNQVQLANQNYNQNQVQNQNQYKNFQNQNPNVIRSLVNEKAESKINLQAIHQAQFQSSNSHVKPQLPVQNSMQIVASSNTYEQQKAARLAEISNIKLRDAAPPAMVIESEPEIRGMSMDQMNEMDIDYFDLPKVKQSKNKLMRKMEERRTRQERNVREYRIKQGLPEKPEKPSVARTLSREATSQRKSFWDEHPPEAYPIRSQKNPHCKPVKHFIFLKTHKTASTTISNICLRFANKQQAVLGLPIEKRWELGGYPAFIDKNFVTPSLKKYDAMCHHSRFHKLKLDEITHSDKKIFTILRDPADNFESNFGFFRDYPYRSWLGEDYLKKFKEFVDNPEQYYDKKTPWYFRAKNYQAYDLGFDNDNESPAYIQKAIELLDQNIHLVMITELIDQSLLMLRQLLCMDIDDIIYLKLKIRKDSDRQEETVATDEYTKEKIREWNSLDTAIYHYFNNKLIHRIEMEYGYEKMDQDVQIFQKRLKEVEEHCVDRYEGFPEKPWISRLILKQPVDKACYRMSQGEVQAGDDIRELQQMYIPDDYRALEKRGRKTMEMVHEMRNMQREILGPDVVFV